jgi:hypothetical protein
MLCVMSSGMLLLFEDLLVLMFLSLLSYQFVLLLTRKRGLVACRGGGYHTVVVDPTMITKPNDPRILRHTIPITKDLLPIRLIDDQPTSVKLRKSIKLEIPAPDSRFTHAGDVLLVALAVFVPVVAAECVGVGL